MELKRIIKEELLKEAKIKVGKDEYEKLFEDKTILALKPLTHKASCKYGSDTKWCVTMRDTDKVTSNNLLNHPFEVLLVTRWVTFNQVLKLT
jgi:hypothetical protein